MPQGPSNTEIFKNVFFGRPTQDRAKVDPGVFDPTSQMSSRVVRSVFNQDISRKWDQFLTQKNERNSKVTAPVSTGSTPAQEGQEPSQKSTPEKLTAAKENKTIVDSSKKQVEILGEVRDEMQSLNKGLAEIIKKGIKVDGGVASGGADGGGGIGLSDLFGGGGKSGGKPGLLSRVVGGVRRFAGTKKGKFAIGAAILGAGAWGLSKLFGSDEESQQEADQNSGGEGEVTGGASDYAGAALGAVAPVAAVTAGKSLLGAGGKAVAKAGAKTLSSSVLKKIPGVGAVVGTGLAINRAMEGDWWGALGEFASGVASLVPGLGTAASVAIDAGLAIKDVNTALDEQEQAIKGSTEEQKKLSERMNPDISATPEVKAAAQTAVEASKDNGPNPDDVQIAKENRFFGSQLSELSEQTDLFEEMVESLKYIKDKTAEGISSGFGGFGGFLGGMLGGAGGFLSSLGNLFTGSGPRGGGGSGGGGGGLSQRSSANPQARQTAENISSGGLGALSAQFESSKAGSNAIGWDRTGGTSYGKYQIAAKAGSYDAFLRWAEKNGGEQGKEVAARLRAAGPGETGGRGGAAPQEWKRLVAEGKMGNLEHDYIKATHFDPAFERIKSEDLRNRIQGSKALQDVLWSTAVQHGPSGKGRGASDIFNKVYREGMTDQELVQAVYQDRVGRFGSSTAQVQAAQVNRFRHEEALAQQMLASEAQKKASGTEVAAAQKTEGQVSQTPAKETKPDMSMYDYLKKVEKKRITREGDYGLGDDYEAAEERYQAYLRNQKAGKQDVTPTSVKEGTAVAESKVTPQVTSPSPQSALPESVRIEAATAQQQRSAQAQSASASRPSSSSSSAPPSMGNMAGPIPDGGYDKLTAVARGDTV